MFWKLELSIESVFPLPASSLRGYGGERLPHPSFRRKYSSTDSLPPFPWVTPSGAGSWRTNSSMFGPLPSLPTPSPSSAQPA